MNHIKNIVFDLGGVLMNFDFAGAAIKFQELGIPVSLPDTTTQSSPRTPASKEADILINAYINGFINEDQFADILLPHCKKGITHRDITDTLFSLDGSFPSSRIEALAKLRTRYKVILLSNINSNMWQRTIEMLNQQGKKVSDCFDHTFLSYEMQMAKPSADIYNSMISQTGINPHESLYFDDLPENIEAGTRVGLISCLVKSNYLEQCDTFNKLMSNKTFSL